MASAASSSTSSNRFSRELITRMDGKSVSPVSVYRVLHLLFEMCSGDSLGTMGELLHLDPFNSALEPVGEMMTALGRSGQFSSHNLLACKNTVKVKEEFHSSKLAPLLQFLPFAAPAEAIAAVNDWCKDATKGLIPTLLGDRDVTASTTLVLMNACHFLGKWLYPFDSRSTYDGKFTPEEGEEKILPLMHHQYKFPYHETDSYVGVSLPYEGEEFEFVVLVPKEGHSVAETRDSATWPEPFTGDTSLKVSVTLPKFTVRNHVSLKKLLGGMGMAPLFERVELGVLTDDPTAVSDVIHEVVVNVDEEKTEAAAATAVTMVKCVAVAERIRTVRADKTFRYVVRHRSGVVVATGEFDGESE